MPAIARFFALQRGGGYTNEYIRFADTKAGFIAGVSAALVGSLVASSLFDSCFRSSLCQWSKLQWAGIIGLLSLLARLVVPFNSWKYLNAPF